MTRTNDPTVPLHEQALDVHEQFPNGLTDFELAAKLGIRPTSAGTRRKELMDMGYIMKSPTRRLSPSGNPASVWMRTNLPTGFVV